MYKKQILSASVNLYQYLKQIANWVQKNDKIG